MSVMFLLFVAVGFILSLRLDKLRSAESKGISPKFKRLQFAALVLNLVGGLGCLFYFFESIVNV